MDDTAASWFHVQSTPAKATRLEKRWAAADDDLQRLLAFSAAHVGADSFQVYATVRDLTDVCRALGRSAEADYDHRAHEIADLVAGADDIESAVDESNLRHSSRNEW